jgi:putative nucleotidyltransferase with HDIG domain
LDERGTVGLTRYLPQVAVATLFVAVLPVAVVWELLAAGVLHSATLSVLLSMALALAASYLGSLLWSSRPGSRDLLFSELMLWGWLRRVWVERRLSKTLELLDDEPHGASFTTERRGVLLAQLATALESRDPYTHGHSRRVARHSASIARRMGLSRHEVENVRAAAVVHDVGKMSTPNAVLRKPSELTEAEFDVIKQHSVRGAAMVSKLENDELTAMVRHHHERLDGTGYPDGLAGTAIPLGARIIAVADTFDAITSDRPYRAPRTHRAAIAILHEQAGSRLDPDAVRAFQSSYSGHRPLAAWVAFSSVPQRVFAWLGGGASVATGSAARVVATSALTGAAAVTAVVDTHAPTSRHVPRRAPIAASSASGVTAASHAALGVGAPPALVAHLGAQQPNATRSILVATQRQSAVSSPAPVQVIGAVGIAATPASGSPTRGVGQLTATGQGRGTTLGGLGGQGFGSGRILTVPGGSQPQTGGSGGQTEGSTRGQGNSQGTSNQGGSGQGGDSNQNGGGSSQVTTPTGDGQTTTGGDQPAPTTGGDQSAPTTGGDQTAPPADGTGTSTPPGDSQTPPPADPGTPSPPTEPQSPPSDSQTWGPNVGGDQTAGGGDSSSSNPVPGGDQTQTQVVTAVQTQAPTSDGGASGDGSASSGEGSTSDAGAAGGQDAGSAA